MSMTRKFKLAPLAAIFFDFDDVLHKSSESTENGLVKGELINPEKIKAVIDYAAKKNIPLYIITARADNDAEKKYIAESLASLKDIKKSMGGFKEENIYCLGVEHINKKKQSTVISLRMSKLKKLADIHQNELTHLREKDILFVDDDSNNITPIKDAGYQTILAKPDQSYFDETIKFIQNSLQHSVCRNLSVIFAKMPPQPSITIDTNRTLISKK